MILIKRLFDLTVAVLGLIVLLPVFGLIGLAIRRDSPGPVFYVAPRVGKNGRLFGMLKFRTMRADPHEVGPRVTAHDDPRITPLGRWLRATKVNELPQLWNVLKGEMSLVGPRPEDPAIAAEWPAEARREILSILPGVTSPASLLYRDEEKLLQHAAVLQTYLDTLMPSKLRLDQLYVRNRSFWLDLDIVFWTVLAILPFSTIAAPAEDGLFLGPISRLARRYLNWFLIDGVIAIGAFGLSALMWSRLEPLTVDVWPVLLSGVGFVSLVNLINLLLGLNQIAWRQARGRDAVGLVFSTSLAALLIQVVSQARADHWRMPTGLIYLAAGTALFGFVAMRYRSRLLTGVAWRWLRRRGGALAARERVLIVGSRTTGQLSAWLLAESEHAGAFHVVGYVDDDLHRQALRYHGVRVIGRYADVPRLVAQQAVGLILLAVDQLDPSERERVLTLCQGTPARVVSVPDISATLNALMVEPVVKVTETTVVTSQPRIDVA